MAFGKSMLSGKREVGAAKFGTSNKHTLGSFKKPAQNHDPHYPGPGKYMLMSSIGKQTESQRPTPKSTTFGKQMKIDGPGSFFNEGSEDMPGIKRNRNLLTRMDIHMVGGALTLCCLSSFVCLLFVFCGYCLSSGCLLFVLLWLLVVFWLSFFCLVVVIVCVLWVAGPGKYGMLGHGPGSPRSRGVVFGTTRKIQEDEDGGRLLIRG